MALFSTICNFSALLLVIAICIAATSATTLCPSNGTYVPAGYDLDMDTDFRYAEAGLQIFRTLDISCDGTLTQWQFIPKNRIITGLHLGVFREHANEPLVFDQIGETYLTGVTLDEDATDNWVTFPASAPIPVQRGDLLGFYYDRVRTPANQLAISCARIEKDLAGRPPTYVLFADISSISRYFPIDVSLATKEYRYPALSAFITPPILVVPPVPNELAYLETDEPYYETEEPTTQSIATTRRMATLPTTTTAATTTTTTSKIVTANRLRGEMPYVLPDALAQNSMILATTRQTERSAVFNIPARCLIDKADSCMFQQLHVYFDFQSGVCRQSFGCQRGTNDFSSLEQCKSICLLQSPSPSQRTTTKTPQPSLIGQFINNPPILPLINPNRQLDNIFAMTNIQRSLPSASRRATVPKAGQSRKFFVNKPMHPFMYRSFWNGFL